MPLTAGTRLGAFEIIAKLGEGGMGEVYRARDTKLGREVALKLLPDSFTSDPERRARFEREARTLASLNHGNIAQIYGIEDPSTSARGALVMELVAGDDLSALIARGPIPVPEALAIARQIADALEAAHEQGIVHRDLKPANVKVRADGTVKVLDFGLARWAGSSDPGSKDPGLQTNTSNSPTLTSHGTQMGVILGTAGYMAPEQARGKVVDRRADIWAFGVVVFEMLTGRRAFEGEEISDVLAAVLRQDLDFTRLPPATPASVRRLLKRCLERDPRKRLSAIGDARLDIDEPDAPISAVTPVPGAAPVGRRSLVPLLAGSAVLAAAMFLAGRYFPASSGSTGGANVLSLQQITDAAGIESEPSLSPDGTSIAYSAGAGRRTDVFVQRVAGRTPIAIAADPNIEEGGPAFSPDGASIAYHVGGENGKGGIFVVGATGESAHRVSEFGFHPSWSPDGERLVFCTEAIGSPRSRIATSELWTVDVKTGAAPVKLFAGDAVQPAWSPGNKRVAFWRVRKGAQRDIATIPIGGGEPVGVTDDPDVDWGPKWSGDGRYLYFASDRGGAMNIWRVGINESTGVPIGRPEPVTQGVTSSEQVTLSRDGTRIAFTSSSASTNPVAMAFDQSAEKLGTPKPLFDRTGFLSPTSLSPNGQWLAFWNIGDRQEDIFVSRPDGTGFRRLTNDDVRDRFPTWAPDSDELAFYSNRSNGHYNIYAIRADGSGLHAVTDRSMPGAPDGRADLLYPVYSPRGDQMVASGTRSDDTVLFDPRKPWSSQTPEKLPMTVGPEGWIIPNQWSPDGARLLGPVINESGGSPGVGVYEFATRKARLISRDPVGYFGYAWLDGKRVVYQFEDNIVLIDVDSGRRKVMPAGIALAIGVVVSRDGKTIYAAISRAQADIWMGSAK
ncbi:MAG TPA: protein kinase [Vicinamibacterales bacterium]|nr:protein kinase [Vicinamibacterales bacterium]